MTSFSSIRTIFFDVGDTLYTNEDLEKEYPHQLYKLLAETKRIDQDAAKQLLKDTTEKLKQTEKHVTKVRAMEELGYTRAQAHVAFCKVDPHQFLSKDPKLATTIFQLAERYQLGLISNFKKSHLLQILDALGLQESQFPLMVTEIKPAHEPFFKAIELAKAKPEEVLYVGDSPSKDMQPAKEVGMKTILMRQNPLPEDLQHADNHIDSINDLLKVL